MFFKTYFSSVFSTDYRIGMASAALSYYLIMSFFPLLIILYFLLGYNYEAALNIIEYFAPVISSETLDYIRTFLSYVSENNNLFLFYLACTTIMASASGAFRSLQTNIGVMQGGKRYTGFAFLLFSIILSLMFVVLFYLAIIVLFFSKNVLDWFNVNFPSYQLEKSWLYVRFLILFLIAFFIIFFIFLFSRRMDVAYNIFWGALLSTVAIVGVCYVFSLFINKSVKYPLVYSSVSSVILIMFWLYCCSYAIYCGALLNVVLARKKLGVMMTDGNGQVKNA